jgi:hypothetical protein
VRNELSRTTSEQAIPAAVATTGLAAMNASGVTGLAAAREAERAVAELRLQASAV